MLEPKLVLYFDYIVVDQVVLRMYENLGTKIVSVGVFSCVDILFKWCWLLSICDKLFGQTIS